MKKTLSIIAALILASCGGTTNHNVGTSDTTGGDGVHTVSTTDTAATQPATADSKPANKPIVIEVAEKLAEKDLAGFSTNDLEKLEEYQPEHIFNFRPWDMGIDIHCFPYKDDGCAVVVILDLVCDYCGMASSKEYKLFSYKDGAITKINNLLPKPGIDDFYANAADFPKDTYNDLKKAIASTIWYSVTDDAKLLATAEVVKWDGEDRILAKSLVPLIDNNESWDFPSTSYIWDGEKFVRDPESKPLTQDLKVFGIATEESKSNLKEMWEKIQKCCSEEDLWSEFCFDCWNDVFHETDTIPYIERCDYRGATRAEIYFYPVAGGNRIYFVDSHDDGYSIDVFSYKDGKMSFAELENSISDLLGDYDQQIGFYDKGKVLRMTGGDKFVLLTWNGKEFERQ